MRRNRDCYQPCAAGELQHRTGLLSREVGVKGHVRADGQQRVVEVRMIVEVSQACLNQVARTNQLKDQAPDALWTRTVRRVGWSGLGCAGWRVIVAGCPRAVTKPAVVLSVGLLGLDDVFATDEADCTTVDAYGVRSHAPESVHEH